jgi:hypothetical protein
MLEEADEGVRDEDRAAGRENRAAEPGNFSDQTRGPHRRSAVCRVANTEDEAV